MYVANTMFRNLLICGLFSSVIGFAAESKKDSPNVLFIAIDDLNDWTGSLGGHPQVKTPHLDKLAESGVNFTNAHCQAPICMPSRASLLTGTYPHRNGIYMIEQKYHDAPLLKGAVTLPQHFKNNGYHTMACGKIYHRWNDHQDGSDWDEYGFRKGWTWMRDLVGPKGVSGLPEPSIFDFGPIDVNEEQMNDWQVADWAAERLDKESEKPFFLAVGFITPHLPHFTPREYFDAYPVDQVELPETLPGDLDDLPPMGLKFTRYFDTTPMSHQNITRHGLWHKAVSSYLACATFTDTCVGRVIDALKKGPNADNTIVVLWSDHGFHVGEKMHWEKRSLWEESTRVPLIFAGPGIPSNKACSRPVGLIDIYPTLVDLCGLEQVPNDQLQGRSLVPLLEDSDREWNHPVLITHHPGNHAIRTERWRYIHYDNGDEELYDHTKDPNEFHNLAPLPEYADTIKELKAYVPETCAPYAPKQPRQKFTQEFDWHSPD